MKPFRLIALLILATLALGHRQASAAPNPGEPAPSFVGKDLDGRPLNLKALAGHVVLIHFWATWCPPCRAEMPMLEAVYRRRRADGLEILALSANRRRELGEVRMMMKPFTYSAGLISDAQVNDFGPPSVLPATYVIDAGGTVRFVFSEKNGPLTEEILEKAIAAVTPPKNS